MKKFIQPLVVDNTPVVDLKADPYIQREGIVTLIPAKSNNDRTLSFTFTGFTGKHYKTGETMWFGDVVKVNDDGSYKFRRITITDVREFNLNNPQDAAEWHIIRHHSNVKGSPNERSATWKVIDRFEEARQSLQQGQELRNFIDKILNMSGDQVKDLSRPFNLNAEFNPVDVIRGELIRIATTNPNRLAKYFKDKDYFASMSVLHRCLAAGKVRNEPSRGYIFNDRIYLGSSEQEAVEKMKQEADLFQQMDVLSRSVMNQNAGDKTPKSPVDPPEKKSVDPPKKEEAPAGDNGGQTASEVMSGDDF